MAPILIPIATYFGASATAAAAIGAVGTAAAVGGAAVATKRTLDKLTKAPSGPLATSIPQNEKVEPVKPAPEVAAPKISDKPVQQATEEALKKARRQKGRALTILSNKPILDDTATGGTARQTLGV